MQTLYICMNMLIYIYIYNVLKNVHVSFYIIYFGNFENIK